MADLKKVSSGERLQIPASTYNVFIDTAQDYLKRQSKQIGGESGVPLQSKFVLIKNTTASAINRFGVLGISNSELSVSENYFKQNIILTGVAPSSANHSGGRFVIVHEPIAAGGVGRAYINGHCQVQINVTDAGHTFCDVKDGDSTMLQSAASGPAVIIWKESGIGTKWAIVRFGGSGGAASPYVFVTILETLSYPKPEMPEDTDGYRGRSWYNCRITGQAAPTAWVDGTDYYGVPVDGEDDAQSIVSVDSITFRCLIDHTASIENRPDTTRAKTVYWEKVEDIRIDRAYGFENPIRDLRNCTPWFNVGEIIPCCIRDGVYYFLAGVAYSGEPEFTSIRWQTATSSVAAVFA